MEKFVGLIRGINVGGHNIVPMQKLREALDAQKFRDVQTYIQSGNLVFSSGKSAEALEKVIRNVLKKEFAVDVHVLVRSAKEWQQTVAKNPFLGETDDQKKLLVTFLSAKPTPADARATSALTFDHDDFSIVGKDIYLHCRNGYGRCEIPNLFFEKKLKVDGTTRNWRTVLKLQEMLAE